MRPSEQIIELNQAKPRIFEFDLEHQILVHLAERGRRLDTSRFYHTEGLRGSPHFDAVVEYGSLFADRGMAGSHIPERARWNKGSDLPPGITIGSFHPNYGGEIIQAANKICRLVNQGSFLVAADVANYQEADRQIAFFQGTPQLRPRHQPLAIVRAGIPALAVAGYRIEKMILVEEKRLNARANPNHLAVGLRFNRDQLTSLAGQPVFTRERAHATMASLMALDLTLLAQDIVTGDQIWAATVGTQQGYELALQHFRNFSGLSRKMSISAGRLEYRLSGGAHPYYILNEHGAASVGDGGDWGDLLLPPLLRHLWPGAVTRQHVTQLSQLNHHLGRIQPGEPVTLRLVAGQQKAARSLGISPLPVGKIFVGDKG